MVNVNGNDHGNGNGNEHANANADEHANGDTDEYCDEHSHADGSADRGPHQWADPHP